MTVSFVLDGLEFTALNGGSLLKVQRGRLLRGPLSVQDEVDYFWNKPSEGGDPQAQQCGWLKDRFGLSWQIVPDRALALLTDPDPEKGRRAMAAILKMKKIDVAGVERAAAGATH